MRAIPAALVLATLSLAGCATLPNGDRWGGNVTITPGWAQVRAAAVHAATDPWGMGSHCRSRGASGG